MCVCVGGLIVFIRPDCVFACVESCFINHQRNRTARLTSGSGSLNHGDSFISGARNFNEERGFDVDAIDSDQPVLRGSEKTLNRIALCKRY